MATGSYLSVITLNVNGLNVPTKRQRLAEWIQTQDLYICCLQETHLKTGDTYKLKVKGWKKIFHAKRAQKKAGVAGQTAEREHNHTHQQKIGLRFTEHGLPTKARPSFPHSQSLPSGSLHQPLILIHQRADRMGNTVTEN